MSQGATNPVDPQRTLPSNPPTSLIRGSSVASRVSSDVVLHSLTRACACGILVMLVALVIVLFFASVPTIQQFGSHFLYSQDWRYNQIQVPKRDANGDIVQDSDGNTVMDTLEPSFGALPFMYGTAVSSLIALVVAIPMSFGAAMFLARVAPAWLVPPVSFLIEFLAAIPSIAYGIWGLFVLVPLLGGPGGIENWIITHFSGIPGLHWLFYVTNPITHKDHLIGASGRDMLAGGLVLSIMIVPIITAISREILRQVPRNQIEGTVALGATWWQSSKEMLKYSRSGLFGAVMLGLARAAGETMAITMVIGNNNHINPSLFSPGQTMASLLANEFPDASSNLQRSALSEVALILLIMSLLFNVVARYLVVGKGARTASSL
jgi:phosphate transport system permease protein